MKPATQEQIEEACMTRGRVGTVALLRDQGLSAQAWAARKVINDLIGQGKRPRHPLGIKRNRETINVEALHAFDARMGCERMLRRLLETGHHHISDPARMASALREARMVRS